MATKPESVFIAAIHRLLPLDLHKEKMNNCYRGGTADVWYSGRAGDLWIEYKWVPKACTLCLPDLSALQKKWLRERHAEGRSVAVAVGSPTGVMLFVDLEWETEHYSDFSLSRQEFANWIKEKTYERNHSLFGHGIKGNKSAISSADNWDDDSGRGNESSTEE